MMIINLGEEETVPTGVYAKDAAARMGQATYTTLPEATHFSFLAECKPRGAAILKKEGSLIRCVMVAVREPVLIFTRN
jgi:predicted dienelactone hydrolase